MVKIIAAHLRQGERGPFVSLELQGDIELIQAQATGRYYATAKRAFISSTFDPETAKLFIGTNMPGSIQRVPCEPYIFKVPNSGEEITMTFRYGYQPEEQTSIPEMVLTALEPM